MSQFYFQFLKFLNSKECLMLYPLPDLYGMDNRHKSEIGKLSTKL